MVIVINFWEAMVQRVNDASDHTNQSHFLGPPHMYISILAYTLAINRPNPSPETSTHPQQCRYLTTMLVNGSFICRKGLQT